MVKTGAGSPPPRVRIAADRLPDDEGMRDRLLQDYVAERVPHAVRRPDGDWDVEIRTPPRLDYYIDPEIRAGLAWWKRFDTDTRVRDIPYAKTLRRGVQVSLSDAWTALSWSRWLARAGTSRRPVILHVDDHNDLMSPRLGQEPGGTLHDLFTGKPVGLNKPVSVTAAINSGAIGMGSFLAPFVHEIRPLQIRHLRFPSGRQPEAGTYWIRATQEPDDLIESSNLRPAVAMSEQRPRETISATEYVLNEDLGTWLDDLPDDAPLLLHIDCDYFNNRFDGDSDWRTHTRRHDPPATAVTAAVSDLCEALNTAGRHFDDVAVALSPSFFPAEMWSATIDTLLDQLPRPKKAGRRVGGLRKTANITLRRGRGSIGRGGGPGGQYWHIYDGGARAGSIWINQVTDDRLGPHPSLTIQINKPNQNRGIGRAAYRQAAEQSGLDEIWLHMRKSNTASRKAAIHAGYHLVDRPGDPQITMRWVRPGQ
jgi:hypothetical protein